jgi:AcrR family transcriptional regulator
MVMRPMMWQLLPVGKLCQTVAVSSTGSLREEKKRRTRAAITDAATALFTARGFAAVTMTEIAAAAGVAPRTLFRYFADKEDLLFDDEAEVDRALRDALIGRPVAEPPAAAALAATLGLVPLWEQRHAEGRARRALIDVSPALVERERGKQAGHERVLTEGLVRRGAERAQARLLARTAVTCLQEAAARWLADDDPHHPGLRDRMVRTVAELAASLAPLRTGADLGHRGQKSGPPPSGGGPQKV